MLIDVPNMCDKIEWKNRANHISLDILRCWCRCCWRSRRWGASWLCPQSPAGAEESWESQGAQHQESKRSQDRELSGEDRNLSCLLGSKHSVRLARCCQSTLACLLPPHVQLAGAAQNVPIQGQSSASSPPNPTLYLYCISKLQTWIRLRISKFERIKLIFVHHRTTYKGT